jgi:hypothetical protein
MDTPKQEKGRYACIFRVEDMNEQLFSSFTTEEARSTLKGWVQEWTNWVGNTTTNRDGEQWDVVSHDLLPFGGKLVLTVFLQLRDKP